MSEWDTPGMDALSVSERATTILVNIMDRGRVIDSGWWCLAKESEIAQLHDLLAALRDQ